MKILYLTYGKQSGVVDRVVQNFTSRGFGVDVENIAANFHYRYENIKFPRLSFFNLINTIAAKRQFGTEWKNAYFRTDYAYKKMSMRATDVINKKSGEYCAVFQSGVLFSPVLKKMPIPYYLGILDNTYLIGFKGRRRPVGLKLSEAFIKAETENYRLADKIFVMSRHVKNSLIEDYQISPEKIIVTGVGPNVTPADNFEPSGSKYRSKKIVMIGLNFKDKGGYDLLEAFKRVKSKISDCRLVVIGDRTDEAVDGVSFKGVLSKTEIRKELENANLFVMASRKEAFGIALIEAMAFFTPCIGNDIEAIPEIIDNNQTGFVVDCTNVTQLSTKIIKILEQPALAEQMGRAGQKKYGANFTWEIAFNKVAEEFNENEITL